MAKINLLNPSNREGEHITRSMLIPNDIQDKCTAIIDIRDRDLADPLFFCSLKLQLSDDDINWRSRCGMTVVGGFENWEEPPSISIRTHDIKGKYARLIININQRTRIGLDIEDTE